MEMTVASVEAVTDGLVVRATLDGRAAVAHLPMAMIKGLSDTELKGLIVNSLKATIPLPAAQPMKISAAGVKALFSDKETV